MATLREAQKMMTRQRLLEEGLAAFAEQGYSATTIDDIATRVGATRATFYLHFSSKAELVRALVERTNEMLVGIDNPTLTEVVASGDRAVLKTWLGRKFDQWPDIKDHITVSHQAAAVEPDIQDSIDSWFDDAIGNMKAGLDLAGRFDEGSRRVRCTIAFGELEFFSVRWMRHGWFVDREIALETMTDSWYHLLCEG
ncbi:TetR/AcrR family transcriptional regulator [Paeniglutamicibacter sp. NPDC012692]|uniref:TetR/AcrR family transcriptional regulator n=1 Tax=Paeniglutamicibacter sp. NPDC012692 TaxID=3364388 RepID=UPI0036808EA7